MPEVKFSLIIATLHRRDELYRCVNSIVASKSSHSDYQIIIVDQNQEGYLQFDWLLKSYKTINFLHVKSKIRGLSLNRNIGLKFATGRVVAFPDDDCLYYPDTLNEVELAFKNNRSDFVVGRIYDRDSNKNIFRNWPKKIKKITAWNFYHINSSITLFALKSKFLCYDERMGVGAEYGSCEDADLLFRLISAKCVGHYCPAIQVWHPPPPVVISNKKVVSYASGFGYLIRKNISINIILLLALVCLKQIVRLFLPGTSLKNKWGRVSSFFVGLGYGLTALNVSKKDT